MKQSVRLIGSLVVAVALYSVPILHVFSVIYHWGGYIILMLSFAMAAEIIALVFFIYDKSGDGET